MKVILISSLLFSVAVIAQSENVQYKNNDGRTPPETFTEKDDKIIKTTTIQKEEVSPTSKTRTGIPNSSVTPEDLNTAPNRAPVTDEEALENTSLFHEERMEEGEVEELVEPGVPLLEDKKDL